MKKFFVAAMAIMMSTFVASAEGYQVNTLSARQLGMAHTGVALKLGAESMISNPGALGFSTSRVDLQAAFTAIKADATCSNIRSVLKTPMADMELSDGTAPAHHTQNGFSTPISFNAAFRVYDNLYAGVSFYTPWGSGINWNRNWVGAELNQSVKLKAFTVQPTVAWRPIKNLSIGAGLMITWGSVNLDKGLVSGRAYNDLALPVAEAQMGVSTGTLPRIDPTVAAASVNLTGMSQVAIGGNFGVLYDIDSKWSVGADFRTHMQLKVTNGIASVDYANTQVQSVLEGSIGGIHKSNFSASMPCPYVLSFGVSYRPTKRWTLAAEAQLTGWRTYRELNVHFPGELAAMNQDIEKQYSDSWAYKIGAEFKATDRLHLRAGLMVDTDPVNRNHYNPETPGMTKIEPTVGASFEPVKGLAVDFGFMYVAGLGVDNATCMYSDCNMPGVFTADYRAHAFIPSVGLRYRF